VSRRRPRQRHAEAGTAATQPPAPPRGLRWPASALACWALAWLAWAGLQALGAGDGPALAAAASVTAVLAWRTRPVWRAAVVALGWPLSALLLAPGLAWPAWVWMAGLLVLALLYPLRAWRDAPVFPTPRGALDGLAAAIGWADGGAGRRCLDGGCGLGAGLLELRRACPQARLVGIEWSLGLWALCAWRCRWADVRRADLWAADWGGYDLVYLFQRPETLPRALVKARREMRPGSWLASLDFRHPDLAPTAVLQAPGRRALWLYRLGTAPAARPAPHSPGTAGKPA